MDMARTAARNGAREVKIIYRRAEEQMPADKNEIAEAKKENIEFLFQNNIIKILPNENNNERVGKIECVKTKLIEKEGERRLVPVIIENSNYILDIDFVFMAVGAKADENVVNNLGVKVNKYKNVEVNGEYQTSDSRIYACGDLIGEKATVAWAARSGRETAKSIIKDWYKRTQK